MSLHLVKQRTDIMKPRGPVSAVQCGIKGIHRVVRLCEHQRPKIDGIVYSEGSQRFIADLRESGVPK